MAPFSWFRWLKSIKMPQARTFRKLEAVTRRRRSRRLHLEPLEDRCVLSGNVVVRWNELLLEAAQKAPPSRVPVFRNLALESVAVYDAVNSIDGSYAS